VHRALPIALAAALLLTGCTSTAPTPSPSPTQTAVPDPALRSRFPEKYDADSAKTETLRLAGALDALLPNEIVANVDSKDQLVPATSSAKAIYGVIQLVTLKSTVDPTVITKALVDRLHASGWKVLQTTDVEQVYKVTMSSGSKEASSWLLQLSADPRVDGAPAISVQLASPDLPN
jgi:hypothetical protein